MLELIKKYTLIAYLCTHTKEDRALILANTEESLKEFRRREQRTSLDVLIILLSVLGILLLLTQIK